MLLLLLLLLCVAFDCSHDGIGMICEWAKWRLYYGVGWDMKMDGMIAVRVDTCN